MAFPLSTGLFTRIFLSLVGFSLLLTGPLRAGTLPGPQSGIDFPTVINRAKERIFPSVVFLRCVREDFQRGVRTRQVISGSGVVISADGQLLTNWHVVENAVEVRCLLNTGVSYTAVVLGSDKDTDLALVQLQGLEGATLPFAELDGEKPLSEGDFVMAFGAPWGLNRSISFGIISCANRFLPECSEYSSWIQTDAAISPGNSGGPLVNMDGRVVGINGRAGGDLGFAIPAAVVRLLLPRLAKGGASWSWSGLKLQPLRDFQRNMVFEGSEGVVVASAEEGSPAAEAGLRPLDRLLAVNGRPVTAPMEEDLPVVHRELALLPVGVPARLTVRRGGETRELELVPRTKGLVSGESFECARWDFTVRDINKFETPDLFYVRPEGVYVEGIRQPGNASSSGLMPRDIILRVNGMPVGGLREFRELHSRALRGLGAGGNRIVLHVLRNGQQLQIAYDISRDYSAKR